LKGEALQKQLFKNNVRFEGGGLKWTDEETLKKQRGVAWVVMKQIGSNLMEGKELTKVALPVYLFEPRSFIERLADGFSFTPTYLTRAAKAKDPVERLKNVIAFSVAGMHLTATQLKPFNPILGETYQGIFEDGTEVFCEQTTHHPPASNFQVLPTDRSFNFWGYGVFSASIRGNVIKGTQTGTNYVEFTDGTKIEITLPYLVFKGLMWGDRIQDFGGSLCFTDKKNDLACELVFNPEAPGWISSWFTKPKYPSDVFLGIIHRPSKEKNGKKKLVSKVEGSWLSDVKFDDKTYWDLQKDKPSDLSPIKNPLPSDSRYRKDLVTLLTGDQDEAQKMKEILEDKQRKERGWREAGAKERKRSTKK